jgi:hypothetical protein
MLETHRRHFHPTNTTKTTFKQLPCQIKRRYFKIKPKEPFPKTPQKHFCDLCLHAFVLKIFKWNGQFQP